MDWQSGPQVPMNGTKKSNNPDRSANKPLPRPHICEAEMGTKYPPRCKTTPRKRPF
ncbi:hypothetical protein EMIT043CA1_220002 [Pseudomonas brassicacearum]